MSAMPPYEHDDLRVLVSAYALDALDPDEATVVASHLETCPECRAAFDEALETAAMIAIAGGEAEPPPGLRDRILAAARLESAAAAPTALLEPDEIAADDATAAADLAAELPAAAPGSRRRQRPRREFRPWLGFLTPARTWATAMTIAAVLAGVLYTSARSDVNRLRGDRTAAGALAGAVAQPGSRVVSLQQGAGGKGGISIVLPKGEAPLAVSSLGDPPSGHVYQLWAISPTSSTPRSLGVFAGDDQVVPVTALGDAVTVAVTLEPGKGSVQPTQPPFLTGDVAT